MAEPPQPANDAADRLLVALAQSPPIAARDHLAWLLRQGATPGHVMVYYEIIVAETIRRLWPHGDGAALVAEFAANLPQRIAELRGAAMTTTGSA